MMIDNDDDDDDDDYIFQEQYGVIRDRSIFSWRLFTRALSIHSYVRCTRFSCVSCISKCLSAAPQISVDSPRFGAVCDY